MAQRRIEELPRDLERDFAVVTFTWEGTAVGGPRATARAVRSAVERLTSLGVDVAIVSRGDVRRIDRQLRARPGVEGRLFLLLSRGSEVYVVGPNGARLLERRQASEREEAALTAAADELREHLAAAGHAARLEYQTNRRLVRVDDDVLDLGTAWLEVAERLARDAGIAHPAMSSTSHSIEIGLTDEGDAARYVLRRLIAERRRDARDLLLVGHQFGLINGRATPERALLVPEMRRAALVSVGDGGDHTPPRVHVLGGGPSSLVAVLEQQIKRRGREAREQFPQPTSDLAWRFEVQGFDPYREREVETWLTLANGATGTRGALEEGSAVSTPATLVAGVFGDGTGEPRVRQPVPAPDWLGLRLKAGDMYLTLANGELLDLHRVLDMRDGVVYRFWTQRDRADRILRVRTARFASLDDRALMAIRAEAVPVDAGAHLIWEGLVGVSYAGGPLRETTFETLGDQPGFVALSKGRNGGGHVLAVTTRPATGSPVSRRVEQARDVIGGRLEAGEPATVDRFAAIAAGRSKLPSQQSARAALERAERLGFDELLRRQRAAWRERWRDADLVIEGDAAAQQALRFSIFHLISTAHPTNDAVSVGARGLSGMSYFLHVFWDTEIFVLPFFMYSHPQTARTLLAYRYRNLPGAREKARQMGHKGALFPWESADRGVETTPPYGYGPDGEIVPILSGLLEHHISADVAWAAWEYWKVTADDEFMKTMGAELLLETARFWASRSSRDDEGRYHIRMVVGPDEYHEGVDDNAYTNGLARWNIRHAVEALRWLESTDKRAAVTLRNRLGVTNRELSAWLEVADRLVDGLDPETRVFEQFAGFFGLDDVPPEKLRPRPLAADLLLGREVTLHSKVVKQADSVMLCYLLSNEIDKATTEANYRYYEPITSHGSSLSPAMYGAVAARIGDREAAEEDFRMAMSIDLGDNMGNAARGLHMATMGGLWQAAVMGFAGVRRADESLAIEPRLPSTWHRFSVPLRFRGARLLLDVRKSRGGEWLSLTVDEAPIRVVLDGRECELPIGVHRYRRDDGPWEEVER